MVRVRVRVRSGLGLANPNVANPNPNPNLNLTLTLTLGGIQRTIPREVARAERDLAAEQVRARVQEVARVPARLGLGLGIGIGLGLGLGRRSSVSWRPLEGWFVASKGLGPLPS